MGNPWVSKSEWIWFPEWNETDKANPQIVYFRKSFEVKSDIRQAVVQVSADSRYRLYLNGISISFGPCKGDRYSWYYDEIDLAPYLKAGENVLAAVVLRYPTNKFKGNHSVWRTDTPGFYLKEKTGILYENGITIGTDSSWKAKKCTRISILPEGRQNFLWIKEQASGSEELAGWKDIGFCDDDWVNTAAYVKFHVIKSISPGTLYSRPIPELYEKPMKFREAFCLRDTRIKQEDWDKWLKGELTLTIPPHSHEQVELSAGELTTGFLQLSTVRGKGSRINVLTSECYAYPPEDKSNPFSLPTKGDRLDCRNGRLFGLEDNYSPGGFGTKEKPEYYEPFWFRTFRFISLDITTGSEPLELVSFSYRETGYPLEARTIVETSDEEMQKIWDISLRTLKRCMHETYEDCPFYEQLQYAMDTRSQILYTYMLSGDDRLARKCIDDFHRSLRPDGLTNCCYPSYDANVIPGFSLYYILMIHDHMMYFGDKAFIKKYTATIDAILGFFDLHMTESGLVDKVGGPLGSGHWSFIDWTREWDSTYGSPTAILKGPITMESFLYCHTLKAAAEIAEYIGRNELSQEYKVRAENLISAINKHCKGDNGLYQDGPGVDEYSQHCQVWAVLTDSLTGPAARELMIRTLEDKTLAQCSVAMAYYLFRAVEKTGLYEYTKQLWQPWRDMLSNNLTTCVEDPVTARSDCHAWGALALFELPAVTLGVQPVKPGFETVSIKPVPSYFEWAKGNVITPHGMIYVDWKKCDGDITVDIKVPNGVEIAEG